MAKRLRARATPSAQGPEPETLLTLAISTQIGEDTFTYYANHAEIASTPHEFALIFARMPTKLPPERLEEAMSGNLSLTSDVQILIPATLIPGLIRALITQKTVHEQRYGTIHEPGASDAQTSST